MKHLSKGNIIVILIAAVALLGGTLAGFFVLPVISPTGGAATAFGAGVRSTPEPVPTKEATPSPGMMYPMKERIVTLGDQDALHYLKIELVLEFDVPDAKGLKGDAYKKRQDDFIKEMANRLPIMDDTITTVLAAKTSTGLSSVQGKEQLRQELKTKLGEAAGQYKLLNVYFTQFIIQ